MMDLPETVLTAFLTAHPQYASGCRWILEGGRPQRYMTTLALQAFVRWALAQRLVPADKLPEAYAVLAMLADAAEQERR